MTLIIGVTDRWQFVREERGDARPRHIARRNGLYLASLPRHDLLMDPNAEPIRCRSSKRCGKSTT